jgi:flagellum-specific peptidoglycan hydrolase FlgJ
MTLEAGHQRHFSNQEPYDTWQFSLLPGVSAYRDTSFENISLLLHGQQANLPQLLSDGSTAQQQFVQPQELQASSSSSDYSNSPHSPHTSMDFGATNHLPAERQETLRRLSLASMDFCTDSYRPRNTPARKRKTSTSRIKPRSDKHARELELNRKAATKCRNRQKAFVENLQQKCRKEEEKMHIQTSLVHALHDEVIALRNEVMRHTFCDVNQIRNGGMVPTS